MRGIERSERSKGERRRARREEPSSLSPHLHRITTTPLATLQQTPTHCYPPDQDYFLEHSLHLPTMDTVRRDLHASTAQVSSLLTRYSKLAAQASTAYSSSGLLNEDTGRRKEEIEGELNSTLETVRLDPSSRVACSVQTAHTIAPPTVLGTD